MIDPEERYFIWQEYKEAVSDLFNNIDTDLWKRFSSYGRPEDKDAPNVQKLRDALEVAYDFAIEHLKELDAEYSVFAEERSNAEDCFNAWCYGLCPKVLKELHLNWLPDIENIAKFRQSEKISQEDTRQAIELWRQQQKIAS